MRSTTWLHETESRCMERPSPRMYACIVRHADPRSQLALSEWTPSGMLSLWQMLGTAQILRHVQQANLQLDEFYIVSSTSMARAQIRATHIACGIDRW